MVTATHVRTGFAFVPLGIDIPTPSNSPRDPRSTARLSTVAVLLGVSLLVTLGAVRVTRSGAPVEIATASQTLAVAPFGADGEVVGYHTDVTVVASYSTDGGVLSASELGVDPAHDWIWQRIRAVTPVEWQPRIVQLTVITEQPGNMVAVVHRSHDGEDRWILSVDIDDASDGDLLERTLVHELGHIATMGSSDFTFTQSGQCSGDRTPMSLGCARRGSTIEQWQARFWTDAEPDEFVESQHVTAYAASSAHEDLAETFMVWVLGSEAPPDSTIAAKFDFLGTREELVTLRDALNPRLEASLATRTDEAP